MGPTCDACRRSLMLFILQVVATNGNAIIDSVYQTTIVAMEIEIVMMGVMKTAVVRLICVMELCLLYTLIDIVCYS